MTATHTFDVFSSLDGYGSCRGDGDWGGYWSTASGEDLPVITGRTGTDPVLGGAADFDLELLERGTLDGDIQELVYRPTLHVSHR